MQLPIPRSSFLLILIKIPLLLAFSLMPSMVVRPFIELFFAIYLITSHLKYFLKGFMVLKGKSTILFLITSTPMLAKTRLSIFRLLLIKSIVCSSL